MITGKLKGDIDKLWETFWTGGITNPLTVIEQISFLMFIRLLDITETRHEKRAARTGKSFRRVYRPEGRDSQQQLRWSSFKHLGGDAMLKLMQQNGEKAKDQGVFQHLRALGGDTSFGEYMADAQLMIQKPSLLVSSVEMVDELPLGSGDAKGDLYEYLLSKLTTAGINGQFRTPRHVIRLMVEMLAPRPDETIADPACGTAGFLVGAMLYLLETYSSEKGRIEAEDGSTIYTGDRLEAYRDHIRSEMFHGFDFDVTMLRIAAMNLMLHGVEDPDIHYRDTLSRPRADFTNPRFPESVVMVPDALPQTEGLSWREECPFRS